MRRLAILLAALFSRWLTPPWCRRCRMPIARAPTPCRRRLPSLRSPFGVYGDCSDLDVLENGTLLSPLTYTCASASGQVQLPIVDMTITLSTPLSNGTLQIVGDYRPRNLTMPTAPGITRYEWNRTVNTILAGMRETRAKADAATPAQLYGFWDPGTFYPVNAVVGFGGQEWQAISGNVNQSPGPGSTYWQMVVAPPQQVIFVTPTLPGAPTSILAAPSVDVGLVASHFVNVTGSGLITSFGTTCSGSAPIYYVTFAGADTLQESANLLLPGGVNITTAANDAAVVQCVGSGVAKIISYLPFASAVLPGTPSGVVAAFNLAACPAGWVASDGTNGTVDLRGQFVRGLDTGGAVDPGRTLGSAQADQLHSFSGFVNAPNGVVGVGGSPTQNVTTPTSYTNYGVAFSGATFGTETRPKNVALLQCQKL